MTRAAESGKIYRLFTLVRAYLSGGRVRAAARSEGVAMIVGIAIAMFVSLFAWGASYFGWSDPDGKVRLAIATSFILGILSGYRAKG